MVTWKQSGEADPPFFSAHCEEESKAGVKGAIVELWQKVLDQIDNADPNAWEVIVCCMKIDSGSIFAYPAKPDNFEFSAAPFGVQLSVHAWQEEYEEMEEACEDDEDKLDQQHEKFLRRVTKAMTSAITHKIVSERFKSLKKRKSFCVYTADAPGFVGPETLQFLWGNMQNSSVPSSSAKELFSFILRKASLTPEHSMECDGDKVCKVDWFGGNFTDKYVDLLEEVPNLQAVCADLKEFTLTDTRIKPKGVERLKAMLPLVDVREESEDDEDD